MSDFLEKEADVSDVPEDEDVEDEEREDEEEEDDQNGNDQMEPEEGDDDDVDDDEVLRDNRKLYQKKMREFFEQEAEVSGSDASEDEVEDEEDELELDEDGDEPVDEKEVLRLNQKLLQKEMLDEDRKMILELQERYLKDGDLHSDTKRERKFRWKNAQPTWVDNIYSSSEGSDDEDDDGPKYKFKMKQSQAIEQTIITPVMDDEPTPEVETESAPVASTSSASSLMNGPSNSILSYVFHDKTVVEALSSVKRKSSTNRPSGEIKRYKPGRKGPSIFDLYVIT